MEEHEVEIKTEGERGEARETGRAGKEGKGERRERQGGLGRRAKGRGERDREGWEAG